MTMGVSSNGQGGDWGGVYFRNGSNDTACILLNTEFYFGGGSGSNLSALVGITDACQKLNCVLLGIPEILAFDVLEFQALILAEEFKILLAKINFRPLLGAGILHCTMMVCRISFLSIIVGVQRIQIR